MVCYSQLAPPPGWGPAQPPFHGQCVSAGVGGVSPRSYKASGSSSSRSLPAVVWGLSGLPSKALVSLENVPACPWLLLFFKLPRALLALFVASS